MNTPHNPHTIYFLRNSFDTIQILKSEKRNAPDGFNMMILLLPIAEVALIHVDGIYGADAAEYIYSIPVGKIGLIPMQTFTRRELQVII